jgi:hypothetical protein
MPKMTHPNTRRVINVESDRVPIYASQGWQVKAETSTAKKATAKKAAGQ